MLPFANLVFLCFFIYESLIFNTAAADIRSRLYVKIRSSSRFSSGSKIAQISSPSLSASVCATFTELHNGQSFEFGPSAGPGQPVCLVYRNVPPRLEDKYFELQKDNDYYEVSFPLPPQNYSQCEPPHCWPNMFCGKAVKRMLHDGFYVLAVRTICYQVILDASYAANWTSSKSVCATFGGKLVEPADFEEQMLVVGLMNRFSSHPNYNQSGSPAPVSIWLGCSGRLTDWKWLDGTNVTTTFWQGTNPDSQREVNCCATLYQNATAKLFWLDRNCVDKTARMCVYDYPPA